MTYPDLYETFVGYVDVIDLDLGWMLSAECWIDTDFYDTLLLATIGPLVVSALVLASYAVRRRRCHADDQDRRSRIKHRHATFLYLISFLVYSTASSKLFQTFACDDLDTGESFLRADHSIQCYETEHRVYMAYAGFMCLVYPFGTPSATRSFCTGLATASNLTRKPYAQTRRYSEHCGRRTGRMFISTRSWSAFVG